jgi:glycosyltransferase involved in cell wall biosynthesis
MTTTSDPDEALGLEIPTAPSADRAAALDGISIVLPAYNEAEAIEPQVAQIREVMGRLSIGAELIVVDDGSSDGTGELAAKAGARVVANPQNAGYGASLKRGIQAARYDHILICDADGTYPVGRIPDLVREAERGFDMVVGARTGRYYRGSLLKHPWRLVYLELCRFVTGIKIPDANSGLRIFKKRLALDVFEDLCSGYSFTTTLTLALLSRGAFVRFIPIDYTKRIGKSKVRFFIDALRTAQLIVQAILLYNPIKLFLLLAIGPTVAAAALLGLAIWARSTGLVVASVLAASTALLIFSFGLMADLLRKVVANGRGHP